MKSKQNLFSFKLLTVIIKVCICVGVCVCVLLIFRYQLKRGAESLEESDREEFFGLMRRIGQMSSVVAETVVSGKVTSIAAGDVVKGEQLAEASRQTGQTALDLLDKMRQTTDSGQLAVVAKLDQFAADVLRLLNELLPKVHDISKEELGDLVDKEMQNTAQAIEAAVAKLQVSASTPFRFTIKKLFRISQLTLQYCFFKLHVTHKYLE